MRILLTILTLACLSTVAALAGDAKAGQTVYDRSCKTCHGVDGTANPAIAKLMNVPMRDLKSAEVQSLTDDDIKQVITGGTGKMKPVSSVSGAAVDDLVGYVRGLKK